MDRSDSMHERQPRPARWPMPPSALRRDGSAVAERVALALALAVVVLVATALDWLTSGRAGTGGADEREATSAIQGDRARGNLPRPVDAAARTR